MLKLIKENLLWQSDYGDTEVSIHTDHYEADGSLYIEVFDEDWKEPYTDLTVCLNDKSLEADEAYVDINNNPTAIKFIEDNKLGKDTGRVGRSGYCTYPLYKFDLHRLEEVNKLEIPEANRAHVEEALKSITAADNIEEPVEAESDIPADKEVEETHDLLDKEAMKNGCGDSLNARVNDVWNLISDINGDLLQINDYIEDPAKTDINEILNSVVTDLTIDIGLLNKARDLINSKKTELITKGEEKAEEIVKE